MQKISDERQLLVIDTGTELFILHMAIAQTTVNGCCDFLAQCILVRILNNYTYHPVLFT